MTQHHRIFAGGLSVHPELFRFVQDEALPGTGIDPGLFWQGFGRIIDDLGPRNRELLAKRQELQEKINQWHAENPAPIDTSAYRLFLENIGYIVPEPDDVHVVTCGVDREVASVAGPQLVVPVSNARYALNAANARWGSLYDALYGTDALEPDSGSRRFDPARAQMVVSYVRGLLDDFFPLTDGRHTAAVGYLIQNGALLVELADGTRTGLARPDLFVGYTGSVSSPASFLLEHHGLHFELVIDSSTPVGRTDRAGITDVLIESALTTIMDFEDSVAAVDAEDKVGCYRNWLGLSRGDLAYSFEKAGQAVVRRLAADRTYTSATGAEEIVLPGRALLFVRNVGHLMTTDAILDADGNDIGEGIMDAVLTALTALPARDPKNRKRNGTEGSIYVVKPKMHGPAEVAFTVELFGRVEELLGLPTNTLKLGLMDEERRTSVNLQACIAEAVERLVFINTGFLDRSGDEIHTSLHAGAFVRKADLRDQAWIKAYEDQNVDIGIAAGMPGRGQIGKGMWAMPELMGPMLEQKIAHPMSGATTAWVPSPTAATLHALHYHHIDVPSRQRAIAETGRRSTLDDLLTVPIVSAESWTQAEREAELDNNMQSLLGYVVRWIDQGVGCSKVPDMNGTALMEDRATLRISSQHIANWLHHGVVSASDVRQSMRRMAAVVDTQNANDPLYRAMLPNVEGSIAFQCAADLIFKGSEQPNGYTEPLLHAYRRSAKAAYKQSTPRPVTRALSS
ncbi:malate synthase G [Paenarthrobacter ureafaciens]|uniref:malate synthase G n=1 Tax=Paenarthrobacter ureafaciens TaxID=37931 RepID=UPI0015B9BE0F|nr:malate synthase G [Paenarthrobacter ureafaciens]NWL29470.1 malate synthase G [Paenarthrobacter ureafaciens]